MKIFKYRIKIKDSFIINLPIGSEILSFQVQGEDPVILALIPTHTKKFKE